MNDMPKVRMEELAGDALGYAQAITINGRLRASKPKDGEAAYVWRMVAFLVSPRRQHQCMPCTADFGIDFRTPEAQWDVRRVGEYCREVLDPVVDQIVDAVDKRDWHGVKRWAEAYGMVGVPQVVDSGEILYRVPS